MLSRNDYLTALKAAIWRMHGCGSVHQATVAVREAVRGTVWDGDVEIFDLKQHPKAQRAYAWAPLDGKRDEKTRFVVVLEIPPVKDAKTAVQALIMADSNTGRC